MSNIISVNNTVAIVIDALKRLDVRLVDHGERVAYLATMMLMQTGKYTRDDLKKVALISLFHDIGAYKTEEIDKMVQFETAHIMPHSVYGYLFLKYLSPLSPYAEAILYHHFPYTDLKHRDTDNERLAALIHFVDRLDLFLAYGKTDEEIRIYFTQERGKLFSPEAVDLYFNNDNAKIIDETRKWSVAPQRKSALSTLNFSEEMCGIYLEMLMFTIDFRSNFTVTHSATTQAASVFLATALRLTPEQIEKISFASLLHDIGKIETPVEILEKQGKLTAEEFDEMRNHVVHTREILSPYIDADVCKIASRHHEKLDGTGYPDRLTAEELTMPERIVAVADMVSALIGKRSYKEAFPKELVINLLREQSDSGKLDKTVCDIAISNFDELINAIKTKSAKLMEKYEKMFIEYEELSKKYGI